MTPVQKLTRRKIHVAKEILPKTPDKPSWRVKCSFATSNNDTAIDAMIVDNKREKKEEDEVVGRVSNCTSGVEEGSGG